MMGSISGLCTCKSQEQIDIYEFEHEKLFPKGEVNRNAKEE